MPTNKSFRVGQWHFYYSAQCRRDRIAAGLGAGVLFALINGRRVEYTHYQRYKSEGCVYAPDEQYLGQGTTLTG